MQLGWEMWFSSAQFSPKAASLHSFCWVDKSGFKEIMVTNHMRQLEGKKRQIRYTQIQIKNTSRKRLTNVSVYIVGIYLVCIWVPNLWQRIIPSLWLLRMWGGCCPALVPNKAMNIYKLLHRDSQRGICCSFSLLMLCIITVFMAA